MKVALVHEFLTQLGGAERVLGVLHEMFPNAPVYTLVYDREKTGGAFDGWDIRTSFLQKLPASPRKYKWYLALMPAAIERFDFAGYDLVISDSSAFAKGIRTKNSTRHICYIHTPTRYLWQSEDEYVKSLPFPWFIRQSVRPLLKYYLKPWDYRAAQKPDLLIANSRTVQERIKKYYDRDSEVIYPPVDTDFFRPLPAFGHPPQAWGGVGGEVENYYLTVSRLEPYKKVDLVIEAFAKLNKPLKIVGGGTEYSKFNIQYSKFKNIEFLGRVSDEELRDLYSGARALVFPALEDAGMVAVEALACGTPVIGLDRGGTAEFVRHGINGVLFENQTVEDVAAAVRRFETMNFDSIKLRESALPYSNQKFKNSIFHILNSIF